jgi:AcrR family transcriptional regulator
MTQIKRERRVSKEDWLRAALDLLKRSGIEAVRVEKLAAELNVSKSGFYYHFGSRDGLHNALLNYWLELDQEPIEDTKTLVEQSPESRLAFVYEHVDRAQLVQLDTAIRQWAYQSPKVRRVWRRQMKHRLAVIRQLFSEIGFAGDELEMRTRLFLGYQVSERELFPDLTAINRKKLRDLRLKLLSKP